jgi:uncharacterized protein YyaL (SSP411 family)
LVNNLSQEFPDFLSPEEERLLEEKLEDVKTKLLNERSKRIRPQLDDKILLSWNALMINSLVEAYFSTANDIYLDDALAAANLILSLNSLEKKK